MRPTSNGIGLHHHDRDRHWGEIISLDAVQQRRFQSNSFLRISGASKPSNKLPGGAAAPTGAAAPSFPALRSLNAFNDASDGEQHSRNRRRKKKTTDLVMAEAPEIESPLSHQGPHSHGLLFVFAWIEKIQQHDRKKRKV